MTAVLELDEVTKVYSEQPPVAALRGVSFSVQAGELWRSLDRPDRESPRSCT